MAKAQPIIVLFLCFVLSGLAIAQVDPDATTQGTQTQNPPQQPQGQQSGRERPRFLMGTVIYGDGSPADMTAQVKLVCDGTVRRQVHTFNGYFRLELPSEGV